MPQRFQRSRRKGAQLPAGVAVVTRPTKWGNPHSLELGRQEAVRRYHDDLVAGRLAVTVENAKRELRGRDLAVTAHSMNPATPTCCSQLPNE